MRSANTMAEITERAPEVRTARERLMAAARSGDPYAVECTARAVLWVHNRAMLLVLARRCVGALRAWAGRPDLPAPRWRGGST
jgi:hypothetical protein